MCLMEKRKLMTANRNKNQKRYESPPPFKTRLKRPPISIRIRLYMLLNETRGQKYEGLDHRHVHVSNQSIRFVPDHLL